MFLRDRQTATTRAVGRRRAPNDVTHVGAGPVHPVATAASSLSVDTRRSCSRSLMRMARQQHLRADAGTGAVVRASVTSAGVQPAQGISYGPSLQRETGRCRVSSTADSATRRRRWDGARAGATAGLRPPISARDHAAGERRAPDRQRRQSDQPRRADQRRWPCRRVRVDGDELSRPRMTIGCRTSTCAISRPARSRWSAGRGAARPATATAAGRRSRRTGSSSPSSAKRPISLRSTLCAGRGGRQSADGRLSRRSARRHHPARERRGRSCLVDRQPGARHRRARHDDRVSRPGTDRSPRHGGRFRPVRLDHGRPAAARRIVTRR